MTQQAAPAGWYDGKYWDGQTWVPGAQRGEPVPESPWLWIGGGAGLAVVGMFFVFFGISEDEPLAAIGGYTVAAAGWIGMMIGIIAAGVRLGGQHIEHARRSRRT